MPTLAPAQIEQIVEQIVTLLRQRERSVLAVRQDDLERGLDAGVWVRHAHLHIQQPTAAFMQQLACADSDWRAVQCVHEAWSLGVQVHISLHQQLLPLLRAHAKHFGKMALVHFDAHTDTYANGCEFDHGTMFFTAPNEGLIDPNHSVQIGIRTEFDKDNGFTVLDAGQVNDRSVDDVIAQVKQIVGDMPVYLTFDIDCLDPAFAPGTGTPVIGGLTSDRAIKLVRGLKDLNIVGMDVVEVAPAYDQSEITALAAATLALEMLYIQAAKKGE